MYVEEREDFGNITDTGEAFDPMDSDVPNAIVDINVKGLDCSPPVVTEPSITRNLAGISTLSIKFYWYLFFKVKLYYIHIRRHTNTHTGV